ncbi:MAG: glycoside hydrolase family 3 C-terminal domain-containing protein [Roseburia sp.]|nr:glycoside hydrolase family 3 C-terminal domain-containing protein [Roseburia sp.]
MADYEKQVNELCAKLTLEEKAGMLHGVGLFKTKEVKRLGIPALVMSDGPMGVRQQFPDDSWIPVGASDDFVTYAPSNSAIASTWDPEKAYMGGKTLGEEARGRGKDVILAPGINIKRDPLCGRNFEYMSEDPYLVETMAVPFIKGVQESDVAACVKHFAVNNQETDRLQVDTIVDERTLREIYLPGFKAAVQEAGTYSLMNAYNKMRGVYCSENKELLDDILREEWGYDGTVISDWGSVHSTIDTANASMDVEMSVTTDFDNYYFANPLIEAVKKGEVSQEEIDKKVKNVLRMMYRLHMLGDEAITRKAGCYNTGEHQQNTLAIAREAIILLKNEQQLPLTKERLQPTYEPEAGLKERSDKETPVAPRKRRIAVIGVNASYQHAGGGGSAEIKALYEISPLMGLKKALGGNVEIEYAPGYFIPGKKDVNEVNWQEASLERIVMGADEPDGEEQAKQRAEIQQERKKLLEKACALAKTADEVIFVGGLNHDYDVEGRDRSDMKLPYGQDELIEALLEINPNTIIVMVAGSPVEMPWLEKAKSLVWCYFSGMETGTALAEILLGQVNPSGKLAETFPTAYTDTVTSKNGQFSLMNQVIYKEGIFVGYRYYEKEAIKPAFPFGYGLSYTDFALENLMVRLGKLSESSEYTSDGIVNGGNETLVTVGVTVTNTGKMAGAEVVQCYVSDVECSVERPVKELKAYCKVFLQPGESRVVTMKLPLKAFAFYDVARKAFVVEPGKFVLHVGNASDNCRLQTEVEL